MSTSKIPTPKTPSQRKTNSSQLKPEKTIAKKLSVSQKKILPTPPSRQLSQTKKSNHQSLTPYVLVILILTLITGWFNKEMIISYFSQPSQELVINENDDVLFVGKNITLEWIIKQYDGRRNSYTHTITDKKYWTLWLRSTSIDINALSGDTKVQWQVVDFINNTYIVDIKDISLNTSTKTNNNILYFPKPWLLIKNMENEWFTINTQESNTTNSIIISNQSTKAQVVIRYFTCSSTQAYDCKRFQESFESTVGVQFTDSYQNKFYKLKDANTRFVNLDNNYWVYIETSNEALLTMIIRNMQFITNNRASANLTSHAKQICSNSWIILQDITKWMISKENEKVIRSLIGTSQNFDSISCQIEINPLDFSQSKLIGFEKQWNQTITSQQSITKPIENTSPDTTKTNTINSLSNNNNIPQIPLKIWKELTFSTKWLTVSFPSPNISFASKNISQTIYGLNCNTITNVVLYSNKESLNLNPSIHMYFCKPGTAENKDNIRTIATTNSTILIEVLDPAWKDFANNIIINP